MGSQRRRRRPLLRRPTDRSRPTAMRRHATVWRRTGTRSWKSRTRRTAVRLAVGLQTKCQTAGLSGGRRREAPAADRTSKQDDLKNKATGDKVIADAWAEKAAVADKKIIKEEGEPAVMVEADEKDDAIKVA